MTTLKRFSLIALNLVAAFFLSTPVGIEASEGGKMIPFEKIYVSPSQVLSTPYGTYYINSKGEEIPVDSLSTDCKGNYVIITTRQCNNCGRIFKGPITSCEGYSCSFD